MMKKTTHRIMVRIGSTWTRKLGFFIAFAYGALNTRYGFNIEAFTGSGFSV
jgi:hypothetical protein